MIHHVSSRYGPLCPSCGGELKAGQVPEHQTIQQAAAATAFYAAGADAASTRAGQVPLLLLLVVVESTVVYPTINIIMPWLIVGKYEGNSLLP